MPTAEALVIAHLPLVETIARHVVKRLPRHVELDDLISEGVIGCIRAARTFQPERGYRFRTYAGWRIRGAMLDYLRSLDILPRRLRKLRREQQDHRPVVAQLAQVAHELLPTVPAFDERIDLHRALDRLTSRQQRLLHRRFWDADGPVAIAREEGICPSRVWQIQAAALARLRVVYAYSEDMVTVSGTS